MGFAEVFLFICSTILVLVNSEELPNYIQVCKRNDPNASKCIKDAVEAAKPYLMNGIEELDVPAFEPMRVRDLVVPLGYVVANSEAIFKEIDAKGPSQFRIRKLKLDVPNSLFRIGIEFPFLEIRGLLNVHLGSIQVNGAFNINTTNVVTNSVLRGEIQEVEGKKRINFTKLDVKVEIPDYSLSVNHIFDGEPALNEFVNILVNQNRQQYIKLFTPVVQSKAAEIILERANRVAHKLDYDQVFPEK